MKNKAPLTLIVITCTLSSIFGNSNATAGEPPSSAETVKWLNDQNFKPYGTTFGLTGNTLKIGTDLEVDLKSLRSIKILERKGGAYALRDSTDVIAVEIEANVVKWDWDFGGYSADRADDSGEFWFTNGNRELAVRVAKALVHLSNVSRGRRGGVKVEFEWGAHLGDERDFMGLRPKPKSIPSYNRPETRRETPVTRYYSGRLGDWQAIYKITWTGSKASGIYRVPMDKDGPIYRVSGAISSMGFLTLREYVDGKLTAHQRLVPQSSSLGQRWSGTMDNLNHPDYQITLSEISAERAVELERALDSRKKR